MTRRPWLMGWWIAAAIIAAPSAFANTNPQVAALETQIQRHREAVARLERERLELDTKLSTADTPQRAHFQGLVMRMSGKIRDRERVIALLLERQRRLQELIAQRQDRSSIR